ncbi:MAG: PSD1 domain-containing protein [Planctomycetales bacterium]|nr:PSD1 domain-containing protein [Planctomycetales bacterium]
MTAGKRVPQRWRAVWQSFFVACCLCWVPCRSNGEEPPGAPNGQSDPRAEQFESRVRPLLVEHCQRCHGAKRQSGGLRLDSRAAALAGGDRGPALRPGSPDDSLLIEAVERSDPDFTMPPDKALSAVAVAALRDWIRQGAVWPESPQSGEPTIDERARGHWAFQPLADPAPIESADGNAVDGFLRAKRNEAGLAESPRASRRELIRRATYALTGLPPSPEETAAFVADPSPRAYERLVDRLLDSPQYGEHWARKWLDVARYSDTKGYVYAREERFWVHSWAYRDWVAKAFREDMPYDRFLRLQLAADQTEDRRPEDLAAMGFLTLGRRFLGVPHDIIDDRIDVVCRGTMALTVSCARCHDHKYDPIPTADYYSLYGVFASCRESMMPLPTERSEPDDYVAELRKREQALAGKRDQARRETSDRVRARIRDYLHAQTELEKYPPQGFDQVFEKEDMLPAFVRQWRDYLHRAQRNRDPVFALWHAFAELPAEKSSASAEAIWQRARAASPPRLAAALPAAPAAFAEVVSAYAGVFEAVDAEWRQLQQQAKERGESAPAGFDDEDQERLRRVLYGAGAPCEPPDESIVHTDMFFTSADCTAMWKLQGDVDRWKIQSRQASPYALVLEDRATPFEPRVLRRGNPLNPGDTVPRRFLSLFQRIQRFQRTQPADPDSSASIVGDESFQHGSGRLELAEAIVAANNPLTPRVIVNRIWTHHFGQGLVANPSDFGLRAEPPSHPLLLDYLSRQLIRNGWRLKPLHRELLTSAAFQQASQAPRDDRETDTWQQAMTKDPANRLVWRMTPHRLTFEEFRDSLFAASGQLDRTLGGKPVDLFRAPYPARRTLYGLVDRQFLPSTLRVFDFANPDLHVARRNETTVPQQALFFMNHPLLIERARALVEVTSEAGGPRNRIEAMFRRVLQRPPSDIELSEAEQLLKQPFVAEPPPPATAAAWSYGFGRYHEAEQRTDNFAPLPHFTGDAWQGSATWPDAKHGWAQLTATGGHPGNTRDHACIRRWTAPRDLRVALTSRFQHEPAAGDGVRLFVVSSKTGLWHSDTIHQDSREWKTTRDVKQGESIDFIVDIDKVLNSDQFLWQVELSELRDPDPAASAGKPEVARWNSQADFTPARQAPKLSPWEQLAQVLLCSNEFMFVD